jgi:uncharacterized protein (DUF2147 family)
MKHLFALAAILGLAGGTASAAELSPVGDWLVKDGYANIRIDNCGGKMWGIVAWEKTPGGTDVENPDPAKKARPILGMPILIGLAPKEPNKWAGEIYNSQNGKMYTASISVADENTLELEGCLVWPLCQTQKWTRVKSPPPNAPPLPPLPPIKGASTPPAKQTAAKKGAPPPPPPPSDVCLRIADEAAALEKANAGKK